MTFADFIASIQGQDRVPEGVEIPQASVRVGSAQASVGAVAGLTPPAVQELADEDLEELAEDAILGGV